MPLVSEIELPTLPIEGPEFSSDPMRFLEPARKVHPWLAKFRDGYVVHGLEASRELLYMDDKMGTHFSGVVELYGAEGTEWARFMTDQIATITGERHDRLRSSLAAAFTPRHANNTRPAMRKVIAELLDEWAPKGAFDFIDFASHFPIAVMCGILGVDTKQVRRIHDAIEAQILCLTMNPAFFPEIAEGYEVLRSFTADLIAEREQSGNLSDDMLLDVLIKTKNGGGLDDDELRDLLITMLLAGYDTSKNELGIIMHALIDQPEILERCGTEAEYCRKVVREALRHTSVATPSRTLYKEAEYDGVRFPPGTHLCFALALTGRDPAAYSDPMAFAPDREQESRHLAFGRGTHLCLGQFLAMALLEEGLHLIGQRISRPRLDGEVTWRAFRAGIWGIGTLPIAFEPAASLTPA